MTLVERIKQWFDDGSLGSWNYEAKDRHDGEMLLMGFTGKQAKWRIYVDIKEEAEQIIIYSILPQNIEEEQRDKVCKFLTAANYGIKIGNFEMDYSDGEVRYKSCIDVSDLPPENITDKMIEVLVTANVATVERYYKGIAGVNLGFISDPFQAVEDIENGGESAGGI